MNQGAGHKLFSAPHTIDLVIFDCDGVLIDSEVISSKIIVDKLAVLGVTVSQDYVYNHFLGQSFSNVAEKVRRNLAIELPACFEADYRHDLLNAFESTLRTTPGIENVLENLAVACCAATSSSAPRTQRALELTELDVFFGANVTTASEVKNGKPAPDLFVRAANKMKVEPRNCLVIEDSLVGLEAALSAGMSVWRYTGGSHLSGADEQSPDRFSQVPVFQSWRDFYRMAPFLGKTQMASGGQDVR